MAKQRTLNPLAVVLTLSGVFFVLFLIVSAVLLSRKGTWSGTERSSIFNATGSVGVLELKGVIMDSKKVLKRLKQFEEASTVKALVIRLDSPGGSVAPSQEIYEAIRSFPKPVVASMGSVAASGAFYVACGAKKVFANPGTLTGSIGVIMEFANLKKLYEWAKVERYAIKTGKFKDSGAEYREMQPEERALLQSMVNDVLEQFKAAVVTGRGLPKKKVDAVADGRIFSGSQAKELGLVDQLGTLQDAIHEAAQMAGIKGEPRVVYPENQKPSMIDYFLDNRNDDEESEQSWLSVLARSVLGKSEPGGILPSPGIYWIWSGAR